MKNRYGLERAATNFKWWIIGVFSVIAIGTASAMYVGGELESALFEKLATDPTGTEGQVYYNTTEKKAKLYNGSAWTDFGSGDGAAGAGEINYNDDPDGASNWTELGDGVTVSTTVVETEIPRWPIKTQAVKLTNDTTGTSGWSVCIEVGEADRNKKLKIEWAQIISTSPAYASGEFTYQLVSETNATCTGTETGVTLHSSGTTSAVSIPAQNGVMYDEFDADDSQYYELKFVRASGASASFIGINDLVIGPGKLHSGAVVTAWEDFTPTGAWSSNVSYAGIKRRVGDNLEMQLQMIALTSFNSTGNFYFNVPDSLTVDTSKINSTLRMVGYGNLYDNNVAANRQSAWVNVSSNTLRVFADGAAQVSETSPFTFAVSDRISVWVSVPIQEWSGSGVLNTIVQDNLTEWQDETAADFINNTGGGFDSGSLRWRRVGDTMEIQLKERSNLATGTGGLLLTIPGSYSMPTGNVQFTEGSGWFFDSNTGEMNSLWPAYDTSTTIRFNFRTAAGGFDILDWTIFADNDVISAQIKVPITEWAGSQSSLVGFSAATATQSGLVSTGAQAWAGNKTVSASNTTSVNASSIAAETVPLWKIENDVAANGSGGGFFVETRGQGWGGMSVDAVTTADAQVKFWTSTTADTPVVAMTLDRDQNATVTGSIGAGSFASSLKNKFQIKTLSADVTASGTLSDLTFSNLETGKIYRVTLNAMVLITGTSATELATIRVTHNSSTIATTRFRTDGVTDATTAQYSTQVIFTAAASTLTFEFIEAGTQNVQGNGTQDETFAMLEELVNYETTSAW